MANQDTLSNTGEYVFSYRVAGVLIRDKQVLLQHLVDSAEYAFPGGHVVLGEISEDALVREFKEEIGGSIVVDRLPWVGEVFFPWGERLCHRICLFLQVSLLDDSCIPLHRAFLGTETMGDSTFPLVLDWIPGSSISQLGLYPPQPKDLLQRDLCHVEHFVYVEQRYQQAEKMYRSTGVFWESLGQKRPA